MKVINGTPPHAKRASAASIGGLLVIALICCGWASVAQAEVSVKTDRLGNYMITQIMPTGSSWNPAIWGVRATGKADHFGQVLNPRGDENGDQWPAMAEMPDAPYHPIVVWSRGNGSKYDLAWSRWTEFGWSPIEWVFPESANGAPWGEDNLDPSIDIDDSGFPMIVWWRKEAGVGRVYLTMKYGNGWMQELELTDGSVDSRYPAIRIEPSGLIEVRFETPNGLVSQSVQFERPGTITDDINPQSLFQPQGKPRVVKRRSGRDRR